MNDEIRVPFEIPLDLDGFLRRECPTCEQEFKWFSHQEGDNNAEVVDQYFCPLCGVAAGVDSWWTPTQLDYGVGVSGPAIDQYIQDSVSQIFKGVKDIKVKRDHTFSLGIETPDSIPEPNDMVIVESPCHSNEPVKIPEDFGYRIYCLVCGQLFAI